MHVAPAGKPLAVCHSASAQGSGEVSAANYEARAYGVRAGQFMSDAKAACPQLLVVPYEFERYEETSLQVRVCVRTRVCAGVCVRACVCGRVCACVRVCPWTFAAVHLRECGWV
jgi:hypothetical protein